MTQPTGIEQLRKATRDKHPVDSFYGHALLTHERLDEIVTFTYLQAVNETLETQALALERMKYPYCRAQWASSDIEGAECDGRNLALQQAADHLRSQKISE